jgi:hypothetical protein
LAIFPSSVLAETGENKELQTQSVTNGGILLATVSYLQPMQDWPDILEDCAKGHLSKNYFLALFLRGFSVEGNSGDQGVKHILVQASVSVNDFLAQKARPPQLCMY